VPVEALAPEGLLTPAEALRDLAAVTVDEDVAALVRNGRVLPRAGLDAAGTGPWAVLDPTGALLAVYVDHTGDTVKPEVVLPA
jgi:hypothetical protein